MRRLFVRATAIVAVSSVMRDDLFARGAPADKVRLIPNGVDTEMFLPPSASERLAARERFSFREDDFVVAWAGRLAPQKGLDLLVKAWPELVRAVPQLRLIIAGAGPDESEVEQFARSNPSSVRFLGVVDDVRPLYAATDVHLLTSPSEGLSGVLLEASASGIPSVVPEVPENLEVGQGEEFLFPFRRDEPSLVATMKSVAERRARLPALGNRARSAVTERYSLPATVGRWRELYQSVAPE